MDQAVSLLVLLLYIVNVSAFLDYTKCNLTVFNDSLGHHAEL